MRIIITLVALGLWVTACGRSDTNLRQQVAGTWTQGPHTLTLSPDGSYTSIFPGKPPVTYKARWHIDRGYLVVTDVKNNGAPMAGNTTVRIVLVDQHHLEMDLGTNRISMVR